MMRTSPAAAAVRELLAKPEPQQASVLDSAEGGNVLDAAAQKTWALKLDNGKTVHIPAASAKAAKEIWERGNNEKVVSTKESKDESFDSISINGVTLDSAGFGKLVQAPNWMGMNASEISAFVVSNGVDQAVLDAANPAVVLDAAGDYQDSDTALKAVAAVQEWAETPPSDLEQGEGSGDRLFSLLAGIADDDMDGEISDAEADIINDAANVVADYLIAKGVPEADAIALLEEFDNELADSVQELVLTALPDGDEAAAEEIDQFVFGDGSDESVMDATYRKKVVIRRGKKVRINKRVSGRVRLTAKQKVAVRKMLRKTHSAAAQARRARSMRVRQKAGL